MTIYRSIPWLIGISLYFLSGPTPTKLSTLSLHDALPICHAEPRPARQDAAAHGTEAHRLGDGLRIVRKVVRRGGERSEEHTSELQSRLHLVCRLLLEKKKRMNNAAEDVKDDNYRPLYCIY